MQSVRCSASRLLRRALLVTLSKWQTSCSASSTSQGSLYCQRLKHRSLVRACGSDVFDFLQGLVTNDVRLLENASAPSALYAMLLNIQGRVLFDLILYRRNDDGDRPAVLIECNRDVVSDLLKTLSRYRLRKKIDLTDVTDELQSWAVFCPEHNLTPSLSFNSRARQEDVVICTVDPRLALLGYRVILPSSIDAESVITGGWSCSDDYDTKRCSLGVGEGSVDFPPGQCFPLESNLAFLNGVSFNKGCYIGQELTARTNYTGVIRKRIVPLILPSSATNVKTDAIIINSSGKERGKVRTVSKNLALGLLHISELTEKGSTLHARCGGETGDGSELVEIRAVMPSWWPVASDPIIQQTLTKDAANS